MTSLQDLQETLDSLARRASENIGPKGKASKAQNGLEINQNGYMSHAYRLVRKKWPLFENSRPNAARQRGLLLHSQSANEGKFKLNSLILAPFLLLNPVVRFQIPKL